MTTTKVPAENLPDAPGSKAPERPRDHARLKLHPLHRRNQTVNSMMTKRILAQRLLAALGLKARVLKEHAKHKKHQLPR